MNDRMKCCGELPVPINVPKLEGDRFAVRLECSICGLAVEADEMSNSQAMATAYWNEAVTKASDE